MQRLLKYIMVFMVIIVVDNLSAQNITKPYNPVIAHRGAWKLNQLPQNSIASLRNAINLGCAGSEFDVRMTADDSLIINHDSDYNNMQIEKSNYLDLIKLKLSNGEQLPTFQEYLIEGLKNNKSTLLIIEIKPSSFGKERAAYIADKVYRLVEKNNALQKVCFISFDYDILLQLLKHNLNINTQYLEGDLSPEQLKKVGISGCDFHYSVYHDHRDWIELSKKLGLKLNAWTVNDEAEMNWLLENKFDFITTNEPELLLDIIYK